MAEKKAKAKRGPGRPKKKACDLSRKVGTSVPAAVYTALLDVGPNSSAAARTVLLDWWRGLELKSEGVQ